MSQGLRVNDYARYYQIQTFINYSKTYIYQYIHNKLIDLTSEDKNRKLCVIFKQCMNEIRTLAIECDELDRFNTPMAFLFPHLRYSIIRILANCSPPNEKQLLELGLDPYTHQTNYSLDYNKLIYKRCMDLDAKDVCLWLLFHVPYYNSSISAIKNYRQEYELTLNWALQEWDVSFTETELIFASNETCLQYALSYHNDNNVNLLSKYCILLRKISPWLNYYSSNLAQRMFKKNKIDEIEKIVKKVIFISDSLNTDSSVLRDRASIIGKMDKSKYDVYIASFISLDKVKGIVAPIFINRLKDKYIYLGNDITNARLVLEKYNADIIVYPDLGMKLLPTLLAYSRIAPIQVTTWGHSETSGIDTIDYYISSKWFSNSFIDEYNYTEKLIMMDSLGTFYISPQKLFLNGYNLKSRYDYGFKKDDHIYCCLQTFYKMNEKFEIAINKIMELDPKGIILLSNTFPYCKSHLLRLKNLLGNNKINRLRWYPSLEKKDFLNLVSIADICLDPFPFGGCNTSYDAFDFNIPVITYPSKFLHGRFTYGLYKKMGLENCECISKSEDEYVKLAVEIAINQKLKHKIQRNIEMNKDKIFQEIESINEWNEKLYSL